MNKNGLILLFTWGIFLFGTMHVSAGNRDYTVNEANLVAIYNLLEEDLFSLVDNADLSILEKSTYRTIFRRVGAGKTIFEWDTRRPIDKFTEARHDSFVGVEYLMDNWSTNEMVRIYLEQNNIFTEVYSCVFLYAEINEPFLIPLILYIKTNEGNFFLTVQAESNEYYQLQGYVCTLYTQIEFKEKFGRKSGSLIINGTEFSDETYIKFQNQGVHLPFRFIMEKLNIIVGWEETENMVKLHSGEQIYSIPLAVDDVFLPVELFKREGEFSFIALGGHGGSFRHEMIDNSVIINDELLKYYLVLLNADMSVNYADLTVNIFPYQYDYIERKEALQKAYNAMRYGDGLVLSTIAE